KYITSSISIPKTLEAVVEYREIPEYLSAAIPFYSQAAVKDTVTTEYNGTTVCGTAVLSGNWCVISMYNNNDAKAVLKKGFKDGSVILAVILIITAAAVIFMGIRFTAPIQLILDVVRKMNRGDQSVRLELSSKDEFGEISNSFNSLVESIYESEQRYRTVVSMTDNVIFEANLKTFKIYVSDNFNQKFTFRAADDTIKESFLYKMKVHKDDAKRYHDDVNNIISSAGEKWEGEYRLKNIYGDFTWVKIRVKKFFDRNKSPAKLIGMITDIDREKKSTITLMQKANFDALTQLYNRATFMRTLDEEMQLSTSRRSLDALMFIDLDDFKHFNDEYGHKCGDEVLKFVADTIKEITFDRGFGGRLGGDEFVMCLTNLKLIGDAGKAAQEMINTLDAGFISESCGEHFNIHCSIGIAFFRENGSNSTELLEAADSAMYKIKKSGKSNYTYVSSDNPSTLIPDYEKATFDSSF
ncbi:MAG: diguanylate cyclase, partial [Ruminococcus sp.]|nr:diguanylate cyclase [Ruminococcus sp.]